MDAQEYAMSGLETHDQQEAAAAAEAAIAVDSMDLYLGVPAPDSGSAPTVTVNLMHWRRLNGVLVSPWTAHGRPLRTLLSRSEEWGATEAVRHGYRRKR